MKILFPTDGSEHSQQAARFINRFHLSDKDEIVILHAISWLPVIREWESLADDFRKIREDVVPRILESASDILKPTGARITTSYIEDFPDKSIIDTAEETSPDLIVMGAKGLRGIATHIVGSVTKTVAAKVHRPVLIVRSTKKELTAPFKILFATDGSEHSDATAGLLSSIPFPDDTELTVLNVSFTTLYDIPDQYAMEVDSMIKNIVAHTHEESSKISDDITRKTGELLKDRFAMSERITKFGDPAVEILNLADEMDADIIALGSSGRRGFLKKMGSVSRYVMNHATCPVLLGR
ncbi:MAG: universal stress protein [Nitrospiraceae bacterium]|nr:MAG: universal stress protein [Nitrospiraceae bacterium]